MNSETQRLAICCELVSDVACRVGTVRLGVTGASMFPALWPGDFVTVRRCDPAELRPGQIVVYRQEEKLVVHRVEHVSFDRLITRGDSRPRFDPPVQLGEIVGRVSSISRGRRTLYPEQTLWQRTASSVLRHSHLLTRVTLFLCRRLRRSWSVVASDMQTSSASPSPLPAEK